MNKNVLIGIIVVLAIAAIVEGFYVVKERNEKIALGIKSVTLEQRGARPGGGEGKFPPGGMKMEGAKTPAVSTQQTQQLADGLLKTTAEKTFNITAGNFYFVPNKITVNKGDKVTFVLTNAGGMHNLVIDELGVNIPTIQTAQAESATFTATKSGSFVYYCSVPGHRQKGMWGTLTVN